MSSQAERDWAVVIRANHIECRHRKSGMRVTFGSARACAGVRRLAKAGGHTYSFVIAGWLLGDETMLDPEHVAHAVRNLERLTRHGEAAEMLTRKLGWFWPDEDEPSYMCRDEGAILERLLDYYREYTALRPILTQAVAAAMRLDSRSLGRIARQVRAAIPPA